MRAIPSAAAAAASTRTRCSRRPAGKRGLAHEEGRPYYDKSLGTPADRIELKRREIELMVKWVEVKYRRHARPCRPRLRAGPALPDPARSGRGHDRRRDRRAPADSR